MELAILIPTLTERVDLFGRLLIALNEQLDKFPLATRQRVGFIIESDARQLTTGAKRNNLVDKAIRAGAKYIAFHDDDDMPGENYMKHQLGVVDSGMDCGSLWGQIYWDGKPGMPFHHSIKYSEATQDDKYYYRAPNHLNCIRLDLVRNIRFQEKNFGEDGCWMEDIHKSGVLKTEYEINEIIYHYFNGTPKYKI